MRGLIAIIVAGALSAGTALASPRDAQPAAFEHRLPAEHTVEVRRMPAVDAAKLRMEDQRTASPRRDAPLRFATPHKVDITPLRAGGAVDLDRERLGIGLRLQDSHGGANRSVRIRNRFRDGKFGGLDTRKVE
jgi:lysyl endopeptidase